MRVGKSLRRVGKLNIQRESREDRDSEEQEGAGEKKRTASSLLTGDLNRSGLPSNLTWSRPCHALALESLPPEVLLDLVPRHVQLDLDDPRSGTRVDEVLLLRMLGPVTVAAKIHLRKKSGGGGEVASSFVCRERNSLSSLNCG